MADNIEIKLDQLTQAIKGLYAKSSGSQGEIYNTLTTLSQRYENLTNVSSEKIASTLVNEFRKSLDIKYSQTSELIKELENNLKGFAAINAEQNPKVMAEINHLINETANIYAKLNNQDSVLQKVIGEIEQQKNLNPTEEIVKLSENFLNFSRGFENITITLNKNFADFLSQVKEAGSKEEISQIQSEINVISGNVNSVISAISIIDTKYRDLTGLVDAIQTRENIFNEALREVNALSGNIESLKEHINSINSRDDIQALNTDVRNEMESVKYEIQKIANTTYDSTVKAEVALLSENIQNLVSNIDLTKEQIDGFQNALMGFASELKDIHGFAQQANPNALADSLNLLKEEMTNAQNTLNSLDYNNFASTIGSLTQEINNVKGLINDEIIYKSNQREADFQNYLNNIKEDFQSLINGLDGFKQEIKTLTEENIKDLEEPITSVVDCIQSQNFSSNIKELSQNLKEVTNEIQSSIENLQKSLSEMNTESSIQIMNELKDSIPTIAANLETFKVSVIDENGNNVNSIKTTLSQAIDSLKQNLVEAVEKIQQDTKTINTDTLDILKVDLQKLSDHLIDGVEAVNEKVKEQFDNYQASFDEFSSKQTLDSEKLLEKMSALEISLEGFSELTLAKVQDSLNENSVKNSDSLKQIKGDILENVLAAQKTNEISFNKFEAKIDKILDNYLGSEAESLVERKSLRETVVDIETKIERTNLQQIHNAKELLEEIQATGAEIQTKINNLQDMKTSTGVAGIVSRVGDRIKSLETVNTELQDELKAIKEEIRLKLKENVQKIAALVEKTSQQQEAKEPQQSVNMSEISAKFDEYISNIEFLKNNVSQEIKENLSSDFENVKTEVTRVLGEFSRIEKEIKSLRTQGDNPDYTYTLEDVESDLAKLCVNIEKNTVSPEEFKQVAEKVLETRSLAFENAKLSRDVETELGHLSGWCKDAVTKIEDITERLDEIQNIGFNDLKTRLVQSEKSKHDVAEQNVKIENALKVIIKNARNKDEQIASLHKKIELIAKAQAESFNPAQFIDIFYENMTQTKMLSNRVEIIEDKINTLQGSIDKLLSYVEN